MSEEFQFTGIVVTHNEDEMLGDCIDSLYFCEDVIVFDLDSDDDSVKIAKQKNSRVIKNESKLEIPKARKHSARHSRTDWIIFLDPDEIFPRKLEKKLEKIVENKKRVGKIMVPWHFYYKGEPLYGTRWGGEKHKGSIINIRRCIIGPPENEYDHKPITLKEGYSREFIEWNEEDAIKHYWCTSINELVERHLRYIENEGEVRYEKGERFPGWSRFFWRVFQSFKNCYVSQDGWREGVRGLFLSGFWAWYRGASELALRRHEVNRTQTSKS